MHTQPMPVYINATATRPAPGRIHISANPNPLVTPVRPIYGQPPQQSTFQALQNQSNSTVSVNTPMRLSTSVAGIQSATNPIMNLSAGTGNGAMTLAPPASTYQPVGHQSIPLRPAVIIPAMTSLPAVSAFQPVGQQSIPLRFSPPATALELVGHQSNPLPPPAENPALTPLPTSRAFVQVGHQSTPFTRDSGNSPITFSPGSEFQPVGHQSNALPPPAENAAMTCLPPSRAFVPGGQQSIYLTPGSVSEEMMLSQPTSPYQSLGNQSINLPPSSANQPIAMSAASRPLNSMESQSIMGSGNTAMAMSPHANQFQSLANPIGSPPNPLQQATMSPQGNQFNPIGSPAMTIDELKMGQSANMSPSVEMTVPREVQMGEMTPTPTGQQVPIHILKKLDANQLQQLQSGSPVPITENQLQEIQGGPVDDSQMDLFESADEDQIRNEEPMKKSEDLELHKNPIDSRKHFTPESFKIKYAPSGSIEYDNEVEVIEDDEPKDLKILPEDFDSSEDSDGDPTYKPDTDDDDDTDEEEIPPISSPFQCKSNANDGTSKSAPAESSIMQGKYRYVKINSNFLDGLRNFENQNQFRMSNISDSPIVNEDGF